MNNRFIINRINGSMSTPLEGTIRLCDIDDLDKVFELQNKIIDYFKEEEKGYFLPFKKESYSRILRSPDTDGEIYGAFVDNELIAWIFLSVAQRLEELKKYLPAL